MVPANAGMSPVRLHFMAIGPRAPRERGDEPKGIDLILETIMCSPRTRG